VADDTITAIHEPHVDDMVRANFWHVRGRDRDLMIDCGLGVGDLRHELSDLFAREPTLVLTHGHLDHMGSAHAFTEVWAHPLEPIASPPPGSLCGPELAAELGLDAELPPLLIDAVPDAGYDPGSYRLAPARVDRALVDGDVVDLGDRRFTVLHLPGHSPGGIALLDEAAHVLFSGDIVYDDVLLDQIVGADIGQYVASMRRLLVYEVDIVHPGHGPSFDGVRLRELIDEYLQSVVTRT
jgi:glyoxylase-like metal-dependent hydrolase (beta-lactamase superfamily II)